MVMLLKMTARASSLSWTDERLRFQRMMMPMMSSAMAAKNKNEAMFKRKLKLP